MQAVSREVSPTKKNMVSNDYSNLEVTPMYEILQKSARKIYADCVHVYSEVPTWESATSVAMRDTPMRWRDIGE